MALTRAEIVEGLQQILGAENVVTDEKLLQQRSIDNFRKLENIFGVYTLPAPAAVAMVRNTSEAAEVLAFAERAGNQRRPAHGRHRDRGRARDDRPDSIVLDGSEMNRIVEIDAYNMQATCQCGVPLQVLEDRVRELGLTTGHSPQSKPVAHMGGLVATRSIGQFSTLYGGIEDMVVGLEAVFPGGEVARIKNVPRRAAGPDIRHIVIGNEGALCFITEVTVKLFPYLPENNTFLGWTLKNMKTGFEALREVMVSGYKPSVARLYDPGDGGLHFSHFAEPDDCVLLFMAEGAAGIAKATAKGIAEIVARHPECRPVDSGLIETWFDDLVWGPEKITAEDERIRTTRNVNRTTEISADWSTVNDIYESALRASSPRSPTSRWRAGTRRTATSTAPTCTSTTSTTSSTAAPRTRSTKYYLPIISIICEETLARGGSIVHHHGIGKARAPWVKDEYGSSFPMLETLKQAFDPNGIMNKGTIIP